MKWKRGYRSQDTKDVRRSGRGTAVAAGGGGIIAILIALFVAFSGGGGGGFSLDQLAPAPPAQEPQTGPDPNEDLRSIAEFTLDQAQGTWTDLFSQAGQEYPRASMTLFSGSTASGCGSATSQIGPHYCPRDQTIYIDLDFFRELETRFGAAGDFAEAYVIAHEVSHHVQNITGVMDEVRRLQSQATSQQDVNQFSVRLELQADCLAGIWARSAYQADLLDPGDTQEAIEAAEAVGDDRIQEQATGTVNPESWTHGSSEQRVEWFNTGFETGDPNACNTF
ncbi:MAG: neutral zinc metallopeptidase [Acidimicrobiia bacterium]|nr:neutral zinc metallopeptidase [Acidimicrobiia bacterium]